MDYTYESKESCNICDENVQNAPIIPEYMLNKDFNGDLLYTPENSIDIFNTVLADCSQLKGQIVNKQMTSTKFKIKAFFKSSYENGIDICVVFKFYTLVQEDICITVMHMEKRSGDPFEFHRLYLTFNEKFHVYNISQLQLPPEKKTKIMN